MHRPSAAASLLVLSLSVTGCSLASLEKPPYCPSAPVPRPAKPHGKGDRTLLHRAMGYEEWAERLWPQPYGGMVNTLFSGRPYDDKNVVAYSDLQDSTIWTGTYLAAEAFRHAETGDPKAKENAVRAARALHHVLKVTRQKGYIARFAGPYTAAYLSYFNGNCQPTGKHPCYKVEGIDHQLAFWVGGTTRDQYTGWFFGMGVAYRLIEDPELRAMIRADVKEVIDTLRNADYKIQGPGGDAKTSGTDVLPSMQLSWHLIAAEILRDDPKYCEQYEERVKKVLPLALVDNYSGLNKYMQYYGFNLDFLNNYHLILLEPNPERKQAYLDAFREGAYRFVRGTNNSFYDYIEMAVSGRSDGPTLQGDRESLGLFQDAPNAMQCIQPPKPSRLSTTSRVLAGIERFLSLFGLEQNIYPQAAAPYPRSEWCPVDFIWQQSPYLTCCFGNGPCGESRNRSCADQFVPNQVFPGADYLVAYWMGRYHGFLTPED